MTPTEHTDFEPLPVDTLADEATVYLGHLQGIYPDWDSGLIAWCDPETTGTVPL